MLTSQSIPIRRKPIKSLNTSLNTSLQREEAKTPEIERVFQTESVEEIKEIELEKSLLSSRALKVKENLNKSKEINAVLLKADGSSEEIKINTSSNEINKILNGRPTIIGELEEIKVIILRSLKQNTNCNQKLNKNILPPPFCNQQFYGNYLLFSVDEKGNPNNLSIKQYQQFINTKKDLIQQMKKNYNSVENKQIKVKNYKFDSDSTIYLQSEIDKKIRMEEFKECSEGLIIQSFIDNLVFEMSSNRMIDPDYDPQEDENEDPNYNPTEEEKREAEKEKQNDWRLQLNEALNYVRQKGKFDGIILAEKISQTFHELNGIEPTLNELIEIFTNIKSKFIENESENELIIEEKNKNKNKNKNKKVVDDILNLKMLKTPIIKSRTGISETYNVYFNKFNKKRKEKNLLMAIKSFKIRNHREPTLFEINKLKKFLFTTNNQITVIKFKLTVIEEKNCFENENEKKEEISKIKSSKLLVTPIKKKKNAAKFNVYFNQTDVNKNENQAFKWFERFNNRKPTDIELNLIKEFVKSDEEQLTEYKYDIPIVTDYTDDDNKKSIINYKTDSIIKKKSSTKYTLNFNHQMERKNGNKKQAIKWFTRFNNRQPNDNEKQNINQFVQNDDQDTIDID